MYLFHYYRFMSTDKINPNFKIVHSFECIYRISANSFRGNYSFLNLTLFTVTFDLYFINLNSCRGNYSRAETIRGNTVNVFYLLSFLFRICFVCGLLSKGWLSWLPWRKKTPLEYIGPTQIHHCFEAEVIK